MVDTIIPEEGLQLVESHGYDERFGGTIPTNLERFFGTRMVIKDAQSHNELSKEAKRAIADANNGIWKIQKTRNLPEDPKSVELWYFPSKHLSPTYNADEKKWYAKGKHPVAKFMLFFLCMIVAVPIAVPATVVLLPVYAEFLLLVLALIAQDKIFGYLAPY